MRGGLSAGEAVMLSRLAREGRSIVGLDDLRRAGGVSYGHAKVAAARLRGKRWLLPLARGRYLISRLADGPEPDTTEHEFIVASALAGRRGCYIAYWTALSFYGYTEQAPLTVFAATASRVPSVTVNGVRYVFVTLSRKKFFGADERAMDGQKYTVSDKAKTIADALDHPEYCGGMTDVARCIWNAYGMGEMSFERVADYAQRMGNGAIVKRMGYLADLLGMEVPGDVYGEMKRSVSTWYSVLDPRSSLAPDHYNSKWRLRINSNAVNMLQDRDSET